MISISLPSGKISEAMVEALRFYADARNWTAGCWPEDPGEVVEGLICMDRQIEEGGSIPFADCGDRARQALAALSVPTPGTGGAIVKPLEWRKSNSADLWMADHPHGTEEIRFDFRADAKTQFGWFCRGQWCWFPTLEAAQEAAQSDYTSRILSALSSSPVGEMDGWQHPDDAAVDRFAVAMKAKLALKRDQGRSGWDGPNCNAKVLSDLLRAHVDKGDPLDVGNLAMMLHQRGERIS